MEYLTIGAVHRVFEGTLKKGYIKREKTGRECDGFVLLREGSIRYVFAGETLTVRSGDVLHLSRGAVYDMDVLEPSTFRCADFDFLPLSETRPVTLFSGLPTETKNLFRQLFHLWNMGLPWQKAEAQGLLCRLFAEGLRAQSLSRSRGAEALAPAMEFLLANYEDPALSVEQAAEAANLSPTHLRRLFRQHRGITPGQYLRSLRLEKAKNLLTESNCSVQEIARACGFDDAYYFSRLFHKEVGVSPSDYRRQLQKTDPHTFL